MADLSHVTIVLAQPSEPRNIGAACRAVKNFGVTDLVVVGNRDFDRDAARPLAIGAIDVFDSIRHVDTLRLAVTDCILVAGTTRRTGQKRKLVNFWPWELAERVVTLSSRPGDRDRNADAGRGAAPHPVGSAGSGASSRAAVVFGNETSGLSDEELQECQMAVNIPTSDLAPSLNLSHAVEVICYELWVAAAGLRETQAANAVAPAAGAARTARPVAAQEVRRGVARITGSLKELGFSSQEGPQGMGQLLADLLGRAGAARHELDRLEKLFAGLAGRWAQADGGAAR